MRGCSQGVSKMVCLASASAILLCSEVAEFGVHVQETVLCVGRDDRVLENVRNARNEVNSCEGGGLIVFSHPPATPGVG
jgi:hypothetical protein